MENKVLEIIKKSKKGIKYEELKLLFSKDEVAMLNKILSHLESEADIIKENSKYFSIDTLDYIKGEIQIATSGTGFLLAKDPILGDVLINNSDLDKALNKDIVLVKIKKNKKSRSNLRIGIVIRVIKRSSDYYVGEISTEFGQKYAYVKDSNIKVYIDNKDVVDGHIVKFMLKPKSLNPFNIEIIGHINDPDITIKIVLARYNIEEKFSPDIYEEIINVYDEINTHDIEKNRTDLTNEFIVTIDGADAKDLDDAVSVKKLDSGLYNLKVSIADVSYYVKENTLLDKEAYKRGTSIYLVNKVIPMLPHKLSNGICSLNPKVLRYAITCDMDINQSGKVVNSSVYPSIIRSKHRLTYDYVNDVLNEKMICDDNNEKLIHHIKLFEELALLLMKQRDKRGSINFEIDEAKVIVDDDNIVTDVVVRTRGIGEKLIEEFMLKANEVVCETISHLNLPFIYRNHDKPDKEKLDRLYKILKFLEIPYKKTNEETHPKVLQAILKQIEKTSKEKVVSSLMLKSMSKANYSDINLGHFGLASEFYTHFTSPIRRYPDLMVHRLLRTYLFDKNLSLKTIGKYTIVLHDVGVSTSKSERLAIDIEREVLDIKKSEFVSKMDFPAKGIISGVTNFGIFVQLANTIEGLIPMSLLKGDYEFNEDLLILIDSKTKICHQLNDELMVGLERVDTKSGKITFNLVEVINEHKFKK